MFKNREYRGEKKREKLRPWNLISITRVFKSQHINIDCITFPEKSLLQILGRPPKQLYNEWEVNFKQIAYFYFQFSHPLCWSIMFWLLWSWALQEQWIEQCWLPFSLYQKLRWDNLNRISWPMAGERKLKEVRKSFTDWAVSQRQDYLGSIPHP